MYVNEINKEILRNMLYIIYLSRCSQATKFVDIKQFFISVFGRNAIIAGVEFFVHYLDFSMVHPMQKINNVTITYEWIPL